jgi:hypothetical protein
MRKVIQGLVMLLSVGVTMASIGTQTTAASEGTDVSSPQTLQSVPELLQSQPADTPDAGPSMTTLAAAQLPMAVDGNIDIGLAPVNVPFMVEYPSFGPGHNVILRLAGVNNYATTVQKTATTSPLTFMIPKAIIVPNFGKTITITYSVEVPGAPIQNSDPLSVNVMLDELSAPTSALIEDGSLDVGKAALQVPFTVKYPSLSATQKVTLNVQGATLFKTVAQNTGSAAPLTFNVPRDVLAKELGKQIAITYTVEIAGMPAQTSAPLLVQLRADGLPPPALPLALGVNRAASLNASYADTRERCDVDMPAYYCSGVMIRGIQNGNFDPWNPSAAAIALGAVSFSFMRLDAHVNDVYRNSGYTVLSQEEAASKGKPLDYLCVYAYDAWTAQPQRPDAGCGFQPRTAQVLDPGTCSQVNAQTEAGWYAFTGTLTKQQDQCSLSAQDPEQFLTSLKVRASRPANMPDAWNEVLVRVWDQDIPARLPISAFFYKNATGLAEAKAYQQKYAAHTGGGWLPVVRLDLSQLDGMPFSYSPSDQLVQP